MIAFVALAALSCGGDDESGGAPAPMPGTCVHGVVRTCFDSVRNCSGTSVCRNGTEGACMCTTPPNMNDGSVDVPDSSMTSDGSMNDDAMVADDGSMPEQDASTDAMMPGDDCRGSCIPEAPDDFDGPYLTFIGGNAPPSCGGAYDDEGPTGGAGLVAPQADCSECTCDSGGSNSCSTYADIKAGGNNSCGGGCSIAFNQACSELSVPCLTNEATTRVQAVLPEGAGSCSPSEQDPDIDPARFAQLAHTCAPDDALTGAGCNGSDVCAPNGPFDGLFCVTREGTHDCPPGPYSERHVFYGDIADTRGCSECSCDRNCDYTVELFADDNTTCMGAASATLAITSPTEPQEKSSCEAAPVGPGGTLRAAFSVSGNGACAASGGEPKGTAAGTDPITFCCLD